MTVYTTIDSPLGELLLVGDGTAIRSLSMTGQRNRPAVRDDWRRDDQAFDEVARQLDEYFAGSRREFALELTTHGSAFQERVWDALDEIPYGTTTTYGALAMQLGVPRADVRDLGGAIAANPLLVLRPCHRVIGSDGSLKGYAGGVERKRQLLVHEGVLQEALL
jgi:methylated-DNA-[protein]-cysteine S-methyltransferase